MFPTIIPRVVFIPCRQRIILTRTDCDLGDYTHVRLYILLWDTCTVGDDILEMHRFSELRKEKPRKLARRNTLSVYRLHHQILIGSFHTVCGS